MLTGVRARVYNFPFAQDDYKAEGIIMDDFQFQDNRPLLNVVLAKPNGILSFLDEQARNPEGNTSTFAGGV